MCDIEYDTRETTEPEILGTYDTYEEAYAAMMKFMADDPDVVDIPLSMVDPEDLEGFPELDEDV